MKTDAWVAQMGPITFPLLSPQKCTGSAHSDPVHYIPADGYEDICSNAKWLWTNSRVLAEACSSLVRNDVPVYCS